MCDGEGGESGEEDLGEDPCLVHLKAKKPQNLDLLPATYIDQGEEFLENCEVIDDQIMQESIFNDKYAGEESSESEIQPADQDSTHMPGETHD
jgi:hypothetical protein